MMFIVVLLIVFALLAGPYLYISHVRSELESLIRQLIRRLDAMDERLQSTPRAVTPVPVRVEPAPPPPLAPVVVPASAPGVVPPFQLQEPPPEPSRPLADASRSLEAEIGSRWLLYIGVLALVIGAAYFQKLAIDSGWIGERARVIEGILAGLALVGGGRWFIRRGYDLYGQIVAGGGVAVLYVAVYAAATLYELIGRGAAFAALSAVTSLASVLADRYRSQGLAVMAVGGGFVTPFLLPSAHDSQVALFTYDGVLIAGTMYLAHRRVWPLLNVMSYVFTQLTIVAWAGAFYTAEKYLATEAFLTLFCAMFLFILHEMRRSSAPDAKAAQAVLWTAPVVYYLESLVVVWPHAIPLMAFLGVVATIGAGLAPRGLPLVRFGFWIAAAVPLLAWVKDHAETTGLLPGLATVVGVYVVTLLSQLYSGAREERLPGPDVAMLHLSPLAAYVSALPLVSAAYPESEGVLAIGFAIWNVMIAGALWQARRVVAVHFCALAATFLAVGIGLEFEGAARTMGWAAEGAAVVWLGMRERRPWLHAGGLAVFAGAVIQLLALLAAEPAIGYTVVLNSRAACGLMMVGLLYALAALHRSEAGDGIGASPFVIGANLLTLVLLTTEINSYWHVRAIASADGASRLGRELTLSISWALYATGLIVVGLRRDVAPIRYLAIGLFAVTIAKVFFRDLAELQQFYRVSSIIALGTLLLLTSYLYNRSRRESVG